MTLGRSLRLLAVSACFAGCSTFASDGTPAPTGDGGADGGADGAVADGGGGSDAASTAPAVFAGSLGTPAAIVADATSVYWCDASVTGAVMTCPIAGCQGTPTKVATATSPAAIALTPTNVYFSDATGVTAAPRSGATPFFLTTGTKLAAVPGEDVYTLQGDIIYLCGDPSATAPSCPAASFYFRSDGAPPPVVMQADEADLWWADAAGRVVACSRGSIYCNDPRVLRSGQTDVQALVVDATNAYWIVGTGELRTAPKNEAKALDGGTAPSTATTLMMVGGAFALAMDIDAIYVASKDGSVRSVGKSGGTVKGLARDLTPLRGIADAGKDLLVTSGDRILRIPK